MTIQTKDRDNANLDIAAENRGGIEYPLNHILNAAGAKIDPATEATLAALNVIAAAVQSAVDAINAKTTAVNTGAIAGTVAVSSLPLPTGAATEATLAGVSAKLPALSGGRIPVELPAGGSGLTDAELRAEAVPVGVVGELLEAVEALRMTVQSLSRSIGLVTIDATGQQRVTAAVSSLPTLANVTTVGTVTNVTNAGTLANQTNVGGYAAADQIMALMRMSAGVLRNNITVS